MVRFIHNTGKLKSTGNVRNVGRRWFSHVCGGKGINCTYAECGFIALVIQPALRAFVILIVHSSSLYTMFHNISQNTRFTKRNLLTLKCVIWLSLHIWSDTFLIERKLDPDIIINIQCFVNSAKYSFRVVWILSSGIIIEKLWDIKYYKNPSRGILFAAMRKPGQNERERRQKYRQTWRS